MKPFGYKYIGNRLVTRNLFSICHRTGVINRGITFITWLVNYLHLGEYIFLLPLSVFATGDNWADVF